MRVIEIATVHVDDVMQAASAREIHCNVVSRYACIDINKASVAQTVLRAYEHRAALACLDGHLRLCDVSSSEMTGTETMDDPRARALG